MTKRWLTVPAVMALSILAPVVARADTYMVPTASRTFIDQGGFTYGSSTTANYLAGNCGLSDCNSGEVRNQFVFTLPNFSGAVTSATLSLSAGQILLLQNPSISYTLTSTVSQSFAGFGTGTVYGSGTFTTADSGTLLNFSLNAAALAAITSGGTFNVSGRVTSPTVFSASALDQLIFGSTNSFPGQTTFVSSLSFTTNATTAVPEPAAWAMMIGGFSLIGGALRYRRRQVTFA